MTRSNSQAVRNPVAADPEVARVMADLQMNHPEAAKALRNALLALSKTWRANAVKAWDTRKPPLAAYWAAGAVNAKHLARCLPNVAASPITRTDLEVALRDMLASVDFLITAVDGTVTNDRLAPIRARVWQVRFLLDNLK